MDIGSFVAAFQGLQSAKDIASGLISLKTAAEVSAKAVELNGIVADVQGKLFEAQAEQSTLLRQVDLLEKEVVKLKDWQHERQRYELHKLPAGGLAYRVKPAMQGSEPEHYLCANCYQDGVKSILQPAGFDSSTKILKCQRCNSVIHELQVSMSPMVMPGSRGSIF